MKTILIPTDFSKNALHALKYAQELYKCERTCFFVLHTYAEEVYGEYKTADKDGIEKLKEEKKQIEESKAKLATGEFRKEERERGEGGRTVPSSRS